MANTIPADIQQLDSGGIISLYTVSDPNGRVPDINFTNFVTSTGADVFFGGVQFFPVPLSVQGFDVKTSGAFTDPQLTFSNINSVLTPVMRANGSFLGFHLLRVKTFAKYLDGAESPDPSAVILSDVWVVSRKVSHSKIAVVLELKNFFDVDVEIGRQVLRKCTHTYRKYDATTSTFLNGSCPYRGTSYYDTSGNPTGIESDKCGQRLSDCKLRFPSSGLPMWAFPAVPK